MKSWAGMTVEHRFPAYYWLPLGWGYRWLFAGRGGAPAAGGLKYVDPLWTGCLRQQRDGDARRDALLGQHLADFIPVIPLIPNHRGHRRASLSTPSAPVKSLHCPSGGGAVGDHLCCRRPHGACWSCPPWCADQAGGTPFVEAGRCGMGFAISGINRQHLWLRGIARLYGIGWLYGIGSF